MAQRIISVISIALLLLADHVRTGQSTSTDQNAFLDPHNTARTAVRVAVVIWNTTLEDYALNYAQSQTSTYSGGNLVHSGGPYGENLFWGSGGATWTPQGAVKDWVGEKAYYDYNSNSCATGQMCGHYTQVVWSTTTSIGCALVTMLPLTSSAATTHLATISEKNPTNCDFVPDDGSLAAEAGIASLGR